MRNNYPYLNDKKFLDKLFAQRVKYHYAKIILLDFLTESYYKEFVGKVTAGSVTVSATSAVRRTCSLTVATKEDDDNDLTNLDGDIAINKKFQLLVGYDNPFEEYKTYGDIIWFPLGVFVFTNVAINRNNSGATITVTGKDKMCLLNGDIAGEITSTTSFHDRFEYDEKGNSLITYPTIFQIIQESVNHLGGEPLVNIIINDLPNEVKQAIRYEGSNPLYYGYTPEGKKTFSINKEDIASLETTFNKGDIVGYKLVDMTYPEDLIMGPGDNLAKLLTTISNTLGNYEFFYDKNGLFYFQEIKNYLNTSFLPITKVDDDNYIVNFAESTKTAYSFDESEMVMSYSNTPNYQNIKNDIWVWGQKGEEENSICYHVAIDEKPEIKEHNVIYYTENDKVFVRIPNEEDSESDIRIVRPSDWRYELYLEGMENAKLGLANHYYYAELMQFLPTFWDFENNCFLPIVEEHPENLVYWLDLIDVHSAVGKFAVNNIGRRTKAVSEEKIHSVYQKEITDIVVLNADEFDGIELGKKELELDMKGQDYAVVDEVLYDLFKATSNPVSAYDKARELLQTYTFFNETITLNAMPLYFLEPNTRITVNNRRAGIEGDFIINSINLPLAASGQMTINATKATTRL